MRVLVSKHSYKYLNVCTHSKGVLWIAIIVHSQQGLLIRQLLALSAITECTADLYKCLLVAQNKYPCRLVNPSQNNFIADQGSEDFTELPAFQNASCACVTKGKVVR